MKQKVTCIVNFLYEHKLATSFLINIFTIAFCLTAYVPTFETNDDNYLALISAGFNGEYETHLIYTNYVWGLFLKFLYSINQSVPWYTAAQYAVCYFSLSAITYYLLKTVKNKFNVIFIVILNIFISYELYVQVQYTKTAGFASAAGLLLIILFNLFSQRSYIGILSGIVLAVIGFMYRYEAFFISFILCSIFVVYFLLGRKKEDRAQFSKKIVSFSLTVVVLLSALGAVYLINKAAYSSEEWKDYLTRNTTITRIQDYYYFDFDNEKLRQADIAIDENDIEIFKSWNYSDTDFFSKDTLDKLNQSLNEKNYNIISFSAQFIKEFLCLMFVHFYVPCYVFMVILLFVLIRNKTCLREYLTILYTVVAILFVFAFQFYRGRVFYNRIDCITWYIATIPLIMLMDKSKQMLGLKENMIVFLAGLLTFISIHGFDLRPMVEESKYKQPMIEAFSAVSEDTEHIYISQLQCLHTDYAYGIFDTPPFAGGKNFYSLGGWACYAPFEVEKLHNYGIQNPYRDVVNSENAYMVLGDDMLDTTIEYIRKHYDKNAKAVFVKEIGGYKVYRIVS